MLSGPAVYSLHLAFYDLLALHVRDLAEADMAKMAAPCLLGTASRGIPFSDWAESSIEIQSAITTYSFVARERPPQRTSSNVPKLPMGYYLVQDFCVVDLSHNNVHMSPITCAESKNIYHCMVK
jgi:hypothetical protein